MGCSKSALEINGVNLSPNVKAGFLHAADLLNAHIEIYTDQEDSQQW